MSRAASEPAELTPRQSGSSSSKVWQCKPASRSSFNACAVCVTTARVEPANLTNNPKPTGFAAFAVAATEFNFNRTAKIDLQLDGPTELPNLAFRRQNRWLSPGNGRSLKVISVITPSCRNSR
jgi:hypothetical protein